MSFISVSESRTELTSWTQSIVLGLIPRVCEIETFYHQHHQNVLSRCELGQPVRSFASLIPDAKMQSQIDPSTFTSSSSSSITLLAQHEWTRDQHYLHHMMEQDEKAEEKHTQQRICIYQPYVYQQHRDGPCGYHAFHNSLHLLQLLCCSDMDLAPLVARITDGTAFWYHFHQARRLLYNHAEEMERKTGEEKYPWSKHIIMENVLERPHLLYLLQHYPHIVQPYLSRPRKHCDDHSHLPITMLSEITVESLSSLDSILSRFRSPDVTSYCHIFITGAINHWNMMCINKYDGEIEMIVADSRNKPVVNIDMVQVMIEAENHPKLRNAYERSLFISSRRMTSHYIHTLALCALSDCKSESTPLSRTRSRVQPVSSPHTMTSINHYLMSQISDLLFSYYKHVYITSTSCDIDPHIDISLRILFQQQHIPSRTDIHQPQCCTETTLVRWLKHYYPPGLIRSRDIMRIKQLGVAHIPVRSGQLLLRWLNEVRTTHVIRTSTHPLILQFVSILELFYRVIHADARFRGPKVKTKRSRTTTITTHVVSINNTTSTPVTNTTEPTDADLDVSHQLQGTCTLSRIRTFSGGIAKRLRSAVSAPSNR